MYPGSSSTGLEIFEYFQQKMLNCFKIETNKNFKEETCQWGKANLFWESLLFPGDEEHVIKKDDKHLWSLSRVKKLKGSLHQDLPEKDSNVKTMMTRFNKYSIRIWKFKWYKTFDHVYWHISIKLWLWPFHQKLCKSVMNVLSFLDLKAAKYRGFWLKYWKTIGLYALQIEGVMT